MVPRRSAKRVAAEASAHLHRSETWHGLRAGDPVVIEGVKGRGVTWEFRARVVNDRNGSESIEVVGGRPGDRKLRSFAPDRVYAVTRRGRGRSRNEPKLSLEDEPQLPLT
ncbi:MAG TPA: hypothetical protein VHZ02_15615 [Acidimicrobiales bacterium]|nr:hypothetical protein [Acidimicrobiales bacterium]